MPNTEDLERSRVAAFQRLSPSLATRQQLAAIENVTAAFADVLAQLDMHVPLGREKSLAVTKVEEAKMWAAKAVMAYDRSDDYTWKKSTNA